MIEVETKVRIANIKDISEWKKKIEGIAKYRGVFDKVDDYYSLESDGKYPLKSLRVRKTGKDYVVNFKNRVDYEHGIHAKKEVEFTTSDIKGFLSLISDFGFKKWLRKEKKTYLYEIKKNFHIEVNNVKGLGWFLEIEYLAKPNEINRARKEIINVINLLEIKEKDIVKEGYTKMLWNKK